MTQSGTVFYTPTEQIHFLLSELASELADAEKWHAMYGEDWNADGFLSAVADLTTKLMSAANQLPEVGKPKQINPDHIPSGMPRDFFGQNHDYSPCEPDKHIYSDNCYCDVCGEKQQDCG